MTFLSDDNIENNFNLDLFSVGLHKEMDVIHHFIKSVFFKKARFLSIEIFESPPHAILTLAPKKTSQPDQTYQKPTPTHIVKLSVSKHLNEDDNFNVQLDVQPCPKKKSGLKQRLLQKTKTILHYFQRATPA